MFKLWKVLAGYLSELFRDSLDTSEILWVASGFPIQNVGADPWHWISFSSFWFHRDMNMKLSRLKRVEYSFLALKAKAAPLLHVVRAMWGNCFIENEWNDSHT